ncbi:MAG: hypothetical protein ACYC35_03325 [Pirellulales bacterium]
MFIGVTNTKYAFRQPLVIVSYVLIAVAWLATAIRAADIEKIGSTASAPSRDSSEPPQGETGRVALEYRPPHNGQITRFLLLHFEVVYQPQETRVYLYGPGESPMSAKGVQGQLTLRLRRQERVNRYPLRYVAPLAGSREQDYLASSIDISRVRDGEMTVAVDLDNLLHAEQKEAKFMQMFTLSKPRPQPQVRPAAKGLTIAPATAADAVAVAAQKLCPVIKASLGEYGTPIKVSARNQEMFVCCRGCLERVQRDPDFYFALAAQLRNGLKEK